MKHAWKKLLAAAVLPCLLAGCGALGGPESEVPSMDHLLGLTQEQRLEDYDYLVQTLGDSYLCMGVRDRDNPEDPSAAIFQAYREMIQESDSDEVFYSAVYSTLFRLGTYGHLWIVEPDMYRAYCEAYEDGGIQDREHWREVLTDPVTVRGYERLQTLLDAYGEEDGTVNSADSEEPAANLHTLLLPGGDVGYVKIDSFPAEYEDSYTTDRAALTDFYRQAADCTDLIIDLTDNSGGSEVYWQQLLAAPLTDRPLSCTNYALLAESGNNRPYIRRCSPGGAAPHRGPAGSAQAGAGRNPGRHPLCGEHPLCGASGQSGPLPRPHLGAGGASGLLRQRVLRRVLPGDRLRHPGGQSHRRRRHRGSGSSLPAAAQQRASWCSSP